MRIRLLLCGLALSVATAPPSPASTRLSEGQAFSDVEFGSAPPDVSPDGLRAVYLQDALVDGTRELWSVPLAGGEPDLLFGSIPPNRALYYQISPDSSRVVFIVDRDVAGRVDLWSAPIGGGNAVRLNPSLPENRKVTHFLVSPTSDRVFYTMDYQVDQKLELFSVPIAGGPSVRLNHNFSSGHDVRSMAASPDGRTVVYRAGTAVFGSYELWSVPAAGGDTTLLTPGFAVYQSVEPEVLFSPDSSYAIYRADAGTDETFELWRSPLDGGPMTKLSAPLPPGASVAPDFAISADGNRVVYRADAEVWTRMELWSASIAGGASTRLSGTMPAVGDVTAFEIAPAGGRVVFRADALSDDQFELWTVPITGGTPVRLNPPLVVNGDVTTFDIAADGARAVYRADQVADERFELWSVPITGGGAIRLNGTLATGSDVANFRVGSPAGWVVYGADQAADGRDELYRVATTGGAAERLNGTLPGGGDVVISHVLGPAYRISPLDGFNVVYGADERVNDRVELFVSSPGGDESGPCEPGVTTLCLQDERFEVQVAWTDFAGNSGPGRATALSDESGDFWFFQPESNEMIVKIIDGCGSTGSWWVSWRALSNVAMTLTIRDLLTGQVLTYQNPLGYASNGHLDIETIFRCDGSGPPSETLDTSVDLPPPGPPAIQDFVDPEQIGLCVPDGDRALCFGGGRFRVEGSYRSFSGDGGDAHLIQRNDASGYAWFFGAQNYEMLFKLFDGCDYNGRHWVFLAGLTNVEVEMTITDTWTGQVYRQTNALGVDYPTHLAIDTPFDDCGQSPFADAAAAEP